MKVKRQDWTRFTLTNRLASLDLFSRPVPGFNIRGRTKITSLLGSIISGIVVLVIMLYATNKFIHLLKRSNPTISSYVERDAVTKHDALNVRDAGLRFAFGIEGWNDR